MHHVTVTAPMWSPSGLKMAFTVYGAPREPEYLAVLNPMSGQIRKLSRSDGDFHGMVFLGWYDEDHVIQINTSRVCCIRNVDSGLIVNRVETSLPGYPLFPCPRGLPGKWVTMVDGRVIRFVKPDLSLGKVVFAGPYPGGGSAAISPDYYPIKVDPMGEWIAWNANDGTRAVAALKDTRAPSSTPPTFVSVNDNFIDNSGGIFGDWTDDGNMLFRVEGGFAVAKKDGTVLRRFATEDRPELGEVSIRRYGH